MLPILHTIFYLHSTPCIFSPCNKADSEICNCLFFRKSPRETLLLIRTCCEIHFEATPYLKQGSMSPTDSNSLKKHFLSRFIGSYFLLLQPFFCTKMINLLIPISSHFLNSKRLFLIFVICNV